MDLREMFLRIVATPDRAWVTLLVGSLLIARECVAPGRILPGMLGGILLITAMWHLGAALPGIAAAGILLILQARRQAMYLPAGLAAASAVFGARQAGVGWTAAAASVVVIAILAVLIRIAVLAHRRKVAA